ncbi:acyl-CoA synthetase [Nocardioides sp. W7]|uniref:acyl-CoA synthetase n=1 Tax=Nocardioides sp. W7 TaxID=2931390 RepID=UPI001FD14499|nr:acyl-CoA synthetase [Nocardioides sp. W7]
MALAIADLFEHAVDVVPARTALVVGETRLTYAELELLSNRFAHHLAGHGVGRGSHVGIYGLNGVEHVVAMLSTLKLRAIPINVNYRYVEAELSHIFDNADLVALVHDRSYAPLVANVVDRHPLLQHVVVIEDGSGHEFASYGAVHWDDAVASGSPDRDFEARSGEDLYILYTGGTTGYPKGVMWAHEDVWRTLGGGIDVLTGELLDEYSQSRIAAGGPGRISFPLSPLMHGAATWSMFKGFFEGAQVHLVPRFDPDVIWQVVDAEGVETMFLTGDAMARPLIDEYGTGRYDGSSLIAVASSAAIFSTALKEEFRRAFPTVLLSDSIGATEMGLAGFGVVDDATSRTGGATVRISEGTCVLDDEGNVLDPGTSVGVVGRVARRGFVAQGYYQDPVKTAETFTMIDGVRYAVPGDFARIESATTLTLLGRGSSCINTGGEKVFPEEVERGLKAHPQVFDAVVVGSPDDRFGQAVTALVQARPGAAPTLEELRDFLRDQLSGYKLPRRLVPVERTPRHVTGKVNVPEANRIAAEAVAAEAVAR